MMKKMVMAVAFVAVASMAAAVETAQEIPTPEPVLAEPVRAAEAAEPEKALTPAEKLAAAKGITVEEAKEILLAAGLDPDVTPATHAARAGFDPDEVVEVALATVWANHPDHQRVLQVYQGHGKYSKGDRNYLFASGHRVIPHTDVNGHGDASSVIGTAFKGPKIGVDGLAVFSQATGFVLDANNIKRKAWFNICLDYRQNVKSNAEVNEKDLVRIVNARGVWNCRERFDEGTASFQEMTGAEWYDQERLYAAWVNDKGGDPSFFMYYKAVPGETVDLVALHQKGLKEGLYSSYSAIWGGSDEQAVKPRFPAAKKAAKKR